MYIKALQNKTLYTLLLLSTLLFTACSSTSTETINDEQDTDAVVVLEGTFEDADASHRGSGNLEILENGTELTARFEDFNVTAGPGLVVLLVENVAGANRSALGEMLELGDLQSTNGNQNYTIPEGTDLSKFDGVMIYCKPFGVVFARAAFTSN